MSGRESRRVFLLFLCFCAMMWVSGCTPVPTLAELEAEAAMTGDWSKVEAREATIERRKRRNMPCGGPENVRYAYRDANGILWVECSPGSRGQTGTRIK